MKSLLISFAILISLLCGQVFASEPIISNNVTVVKNATPAQCPASWEGSVAPDQMQVESGAGTSTMLTSPIIRSCEGCAIEPSSGDCVCKKCYDHYDN